MSEDFGRVAVLMGGASAEREVSLNSGNAVLEALRTGGIDATGIDADQQVMQKLEQQSIDRVFIALHGRWGEDGVIQGALEVQGMPYTGSGVLGSALGMDKLRTKRLWQGAGIQTPDFMVVDGASDLENVVQKLGLPLFVKPCHEGSSIGISKVESRSELEQAAKEAGRFDREVFAEVAIEGTELTAAVLQDRVLPLIRLETPRTFYDYEAKYQSDTTRYHCPSGLDTETEQRLQQLAQQAFEALGCAGWGRVDLMLDQKNEPWLLEVNTVPGMTDHSLVPMAARQAGIEFPELVRQILETTSD